MWIAVIVLIVSKAAHIWPPRRRIKIPVAVCKTHTAWQLQRVSPLGHQMFSPLAYSLNANTLGNATELCKTIVFLQPPLTEKSFFKNHFTLESFHCVQCKKYAHTVAHTICTGCALGANVGKSKRFNLRSRTWSSKLGTINERQTSASGASAFPDCTRREESWSKKSRGIRSFFSRSPLKPLSSWTKLFFFQKKTFLTFNVWTFVTSAT